MKIQDAYNEWSEIYDSNQNLTRDLDQMVTYNALNGQVFSSILELGCGTGKNTVFLAQLGAAVHAMDFSEKMIAKAAEKVKMANVRFSMADLTLPWPCNDAAYDLIVCNLVLEHVSSLEHIFAEAARTLQPKGKFLINELHPFKQYQGTKARFERGEEIIEVDVFVHHISEFTNAAACSGLGLLKLGEHWHEIDTGKPPRLISLLFEK